MSRAQRAAADLKHLFCEEDQSALNEVALDYFTCRDSEYYDSEDDSGDEETSFDTSTGKIITVTVRWVFLNILWFL